VPESTRIDEGIDIKLDTVLLGIITSRRRSTDLQKRKMTATKRKKTTDILAKKGGNLKLLIEYRAFNMHTIMKR
jgi:hypothetical protein